MKQFKDRVLQLMAGSGREVNTEVPDGQGRLERIPVRGADAIPVVLIAGTKFTAPAPANPAVWPNDGLVAEESALATSIGDPVLPHRRCYTFDDTHSIFVSNTAGLEWKTALTWDPQVFEVLHQAIGDAPRALRAPIGRAARRPEPQFSGRHRWRRRRPA